jgi:NAD+ synthase (glutamine-hydrolysing)
MNFGFLRCAAVSPETRPAAVTANVQAIIRALAEVDDADLVVFPELSVSGYTCGDLFLQGTLLADVERGLSRLAKATEAFAGTTVVGAPVRRDGLLYNCAVVLGHGQILGIVPKSYLPNSNEYYEGRWFSPGHDTTGEANVAGVAVPFGVDLLFSDGAEGGFTLAVEICEDLWSPVPPSSLASLAGANVIANLSASNEVVGKQAYRRSLVLQQSARSRAAYVYASSGPGESTTDTVFSGATFISENGTMLAEGPRFQRQTARAKADVDLERLAFDRRQATSFGEGVRRHRPQLRAVPIDPPRKKEDLLRSIHTQPFVPRVDTELHSRCEEILAIQSHGLATRMKRIGCEAAVIGLSGGLDSTLALIVIREAFAQLGLDPSGVHAVTMPGFGTSGTTRGNVDALAAAFGIKLMDVPISESSRLQLSMLQHPEDRHDVTYENVQARERTSFLMNYANQVGGIVVGTGDLSELALGWCTYNADHMSMYAVNSGVPKTLVKFLIEWYSAHRADVPMAEALRAVLATPISPELLPLDRTGGIAQKTEDVLGPYEVHDFFLYYLVRFGFRPSKLLFLAERAFTGQYGAESLRDWLKLFLRRFFSQQFKRSCLPDGPKVGSIALSPRADWRMPSDASAESWIAQLESGS